MSTGLPTDTNNGDRPDDELQGLDHHEGQPARQLRGLSQPTPEQIRQHKLTHLPYRTWCNVCVGSESQIGQCRLQRHGSIVQLDNASMHDPNMSAVPPISNIARRQLTALATAESSTGMCGADLCTKNSVTTGALNYIKKLVIENGFVNSCVTSQSDNKPDRAHQRSSATTGTSCLTSPNVRTEVTMVDGMFSQHPVCATYRGSISVDNRCQYSSSQHP